MWYQHSYLETDTHRANSELCERVRAATGESLTNIDFNVEWASVKHGKIKTHAITILAKPGDHHEILEALMQVREDNSHMYPITQLWVASPVVVMSAEDSPKIELAMKTNSEDINNRTYVDLTGVPPETDLHTVILNRTYLKGETQLVNGKTVAQLLLGGCTEIGDTIITSPIQTVSQAEWGRWRFRAYKADAEPLL